MTQKPAARANAMEQALAAARAAGASKETLAALSQDASTARRAVADGRPLGARLDSARAQLARAGRNLEAAEAGIAQATARREKAAAEAEAARSSLAALEAEVATATAAEAAEGRTAAEGSAPTVLSSAQTLLQRMETGRWATSATLPEEMLSAMRDLHVAVAQAMGPMPTPRLDAALEDSQDGPPEPPSQAVPAGRAAVGEDDGDNDSEDAVMEALVDTDESDEQALAAIARRLKRARAGPY